MSNRNPTGISRKSAARAASKQPGSGTRLAVVALTLGIFSPIVLLFFGVLAGLVAVPAIICGYLARKQILTNGGNQSGLGIAIAGMVGGSVIMAILLVFTIILFV